MEKEFRSALANIDRNYSVIQRILEEVLNMSVALDRLKQEVAESKTVTESAVTLIQGLRSKLAEIVADGTDPEEVAQLANDLDAATASLAVAVAAGTKVDPVAPVADAPVEPATPEVPVNDPVEVPE